MLNAQSIAKDHLRAVTINVHFEQWIQRLKKSVATVGGYYEEMQAKKKEICFKVIEKYFNLNRWSHSFLKINTLV